MLKENLPRTVHPAGELPSVAGELADGPVVVDTYAGPVRVEWDADASVTALGHLAFFVEYLKLSGRFDALLADCPLVYASGNAPAVRDVVGTAVLGILAGHWRYAHLTALRGDSVSPARLGMSRVVSEDAVRRGLATIEAAAGEAWRHRHPKDREFAVLVTSLDLEICSLAQLYRDRGDSENPFDELKNQGGWAGFTTSDLTRCQIMARLIALVYNWWTLYVRLADPDHHHEALTTRSLLLNAVARQTRHAGQTRLTVTSSHGRREQVTAALQRIARFFTMLRKTAEQLTDLDRWYRILSHALVKYLKGRQLDPPRRLQAA